MEIEGQSLPLHKAGGNLPNWQALEALALTLVFYINLTRCISLVGGCSIVIIVDHCHNVYLSVALSACLAINPFTTLATKRIQVCKQAGQADGSLM